MKFSIPSKLASLGMAAQNALKGEPIRAINYGAIAVVYIAVKVLVATGNMADPPDFDGISIGVAAAIAAVTELSRRFVFSPNSVDVLIDVAEFGGGEVAREGQPLLK